MAQTKEGALKIAAKKAGTTTADYQRRVASGEKWCIVCRRWHPSDEFGKDATRWDGLTAACLQSKREKQKAAYRPKPRKAVKGRLFVPARDGDVRQARRRVNYFVEAGLLPNPNTLPCVDCGHVVVPGERRHEYDHFLGYAAENHERVQVVCSRCHHRREMSKAEV